MTIFLSIFPLLLVAIAVVGFVAAGNDHLAADVIDKLGLPGAGAEVAIQLPLAAITLPDTKT